MKRVSLLLLIVGLIFSQLFFVSFNLNNGFQFHELVIRLLPIAEYAGNESPQLYLTSILIGYAAFVAFGVLNTNKIKSPETFKSALMFSGISVVVAFFEFTSILEDLYGNFHGRHFRIGWLLFLLGLWIFSKRYLAKK